MKCEHCGSEDIVAIQGQNYCLNCGYAVKEKAIPAVLAPTEASLEPSPVIASAKPPVRKVAKIVRAPKPKKARSSASRARTSKPKANKAAVLTEPRTTPLPYAVTSKPVAEAQPKHEHKASRPSTRLSAHPLRFSVTISALLGLGIGVVTGIGVWLQFDTDIVLYLLAAGVIGVGIMLTLAQAALLYGLSRNYDGRPAQRKLWWGAARSGFMDTINVNLASLLSLVVIASVAAGLSRLALAQFADSRILLTGVLGLINLIGVWLLLGVYVAKRMAIPAVVIGGMTAAQGFRIAWNFYIRAGGHLVGAALEVLLTRIIATLLAAVVATCGVVAFDRGIPIAAPVIVGAMVGVLCFIGGMTLLEIEMRLWLRQYRQWANMLTSPVRMQLVTGRVRLSARQTTP